MARPNTRASFKEYCLRSLGKPVIDINVDEDQIEDRIDEAVQYFSQYHTDGVERMYLKYKVTAEDKVRLRKNKDFNVIEPGTYADNIELEDATNTNLGGDQPSKGDLIKEDGTPIHLEDSNIVETTYQENQNYLVIPEAVLSVINVFPLSDRANLNMFDVRYQLRLNDLYDFSSTSIVHYEMTMRHLDFLDHILVGEKPIRFNTLSNRLYIDMDWNEDIDADEYLIIECYRQIDPTQHTRMFDDIMLKRYATALIKRQWGQNLSKFNGTAMLGGVTLNGPELFSTAISEQQKLEEEIRLNFEEPPHIMQG
jgi:predicted transcriptional regulator